MTAIMLRSISAKCGTINIKIADTRNAYPKQYLDEILLKPDITYATAGTHNIIVKIIKKILKLLSFFSLLRKSSSTAGSASTLNPSMVQTPNPFGSTINSNINLL